MQIIQLNNYESLCIVMLMQVDFRQLISIEVIITLYIVSNKNARDTRITEDTPEFNHSMHLAV